MVHPSALQLVAGLWQLLGCAWGHHGDPQCPLDGVQRGFDIADLPDGWVVHYDQPYSHPTQLSNVWPGRGVCVLWAAKESDRASKFAIVAFGDRQKIENTGIVHTSEVFWYTVDGQATGFSPLSNIDLQPGDQGPYQCINRLSWLLGGSGGYRAGCQLDMENNNVWRKVVMYGPEADRCQQNYCPVGYNFRPDAPRYCHGSQCTQQECCTVADICRASLCSAGFTMKEQVPEYCSSISCQQWECCDRLPVCTAEACTVGYLLKPPQSLPPYCQERVCGQPECCDPALRCDNYNCPYGFVHTDVVYCATWECQLGECCHPAGVCSDVSCLTPYSPRTVGKPDFCAGTSCTLLECCDPPAPDFNVSGASFIDWDLDADEVGGLLRWRPPDNAGNIVSHYSIYIGRDYIRRKIGHVPWGSNQFSVPMNTPVGELFFIYTANRGGEQKVPVTLTIWDQTYRLKNLSLMDLDLDAGQIGGLVTWIPPSMPGLVISHSVYLAAWDTYNHSRYHVGNASAGTNHLSIPVDTELADFDHIQVFGDSDVTEMSRPNKAAIIDTAATVADVVFTDEEDHPGLVGGYVEWLPPADTQYVAAYRVYFAGNTSAIEQLAVAEDVEVGTNRAYVPAGTVKGNFTNVLVYTVSSLSEQTTPARGLLTEKEDTYILTMTVVVGSIVGLRAISVLAGTTTAARAGGTPDLEALERTEKVEQNPVDVPITDVYFSIDGTEEVVIKHLETPGVRKLFSALFPGCVHPHHRKIVLHHAGSAMVLHRHRKCKNSWYSNGILMKKLANNAISVHGLSVDGPSTGKRLRLKRRRRTFHRHTETTLRAFTPLFALVVIAVIIIWLQELALGLVIIGTALMGLIALYLAEPGSIFSVCICAIADAPPKPIRRVFWLVISAVVAVLPCAPAFLSGTLIGLATGVVALVGALLNLAGLGQLAAWFEAATGFVFAVLALMEQQKMGPTELRASRTLVVVFLAAALIFVKGIDGCFAWLTAHYINIRLPDDPMVVAAQSMSESTGLTLIGALNLEAFAMGEAEMPMQDNLVKALQALAHRIADLCNAMLIRAADELSGDAFKKTQQSIEPNLNRARALAEAELSPNKEEAQLHVEELQALMGKLSSRCFGEVNIRRCRESISRVRGACIRLEAALNIISRVHPADTLAAHRVHSTILGSHGSEIASIAQSADPRIPTGAGRVVQMGHLHAIVEIMLERNMRIDGVLALLLARKVGGKEWQGNTALSLTACETAVTNVTGALQAVRRVLRPMTPMQGEPEDLGSAEVSAVSDWFTDITSGANAIDRLSQRLEDLDEMQDVTTKVSPEVRGVVLQYASPCRDEDFIERATTSLSVARNVAAVASVALEEVYTLLQRADNAVQAMMTARTEGQNSVESRRLSHRKLDLMSTLDFGVLQRETAEVLGGSAIVAAVRVEDVASQEKLYKLQAVVREELKRARLPLANLSDPPVTAPEKQPSWFRGISTKAKREKRERVISTTPSPPLFNRSVTSASWRVRKTVPEPHKKLSKEVDALSDLWAEATKTHLPQSGKQPDHDHSSMHSLRGSAGQLLDCDATAALNSNSLA